jgi:uncharacterized protein (TIGR03083 family)
MALEPASYLKYLRSDGEALADAARTAPSAAVPSCPEWDMTALVTHVGGLYSWVDHILRTRATEYAKRQTEAPDGAQATLEWYEEALRQILSTLGETDPDQEVWNWRDRGPAPARFWWRRMAHETAIHRWDGEAAVGSTSPIAAELAVDGIDEYLSFVGLWLSRNPVEGLTGSLHLHATDTDGEWSLDLSPDHLEHRREHSKADAAIRGPVSDLLLWMVNRVPVDAPGFQVFGDRALMDRWGQLTF